MIVKRIDPLSCSKLFGVLYALLGLLAGIVASFTALLGVSVQEVAIEGAPAVGPVATAVFGIGAIVIFPIFNGIAGFVGSLIGAFLYNLAASFVGGIEIELAHE